MHCRLGVFHGLIARLIAVAVFAVAAPLVATVLVATGAASAQSPEKRIALVIGNNAYETLPRLGNAATDARDMGRALELAGFDTTVRTDVKRRELYQVIDAFAAKIAGGPDTVGLFYYAGHGIQANGKNYLVPVDGNLTSDADLEPEAVDAGKVLRAMDQARNRMNIVILDACRDNPLPKGRSLARGLTSMHAPRGTFIGYAAGPGQSAQDGEPGKNGVFTGVLVKQLAVPGLQLEEVFKRVIAGVSERTAGQQLPWMESSVQGNFFFVPPAASQATQTPSAAAPVDPEIVFWQSIPQNATAADYEEYLRQFPQGRFAGLARNRLVALSNPPSSSPPSGARLPSEAAVKSAPIGPPCGGNSDAQIAAPIVALYDSIRTMNIEAYAAQWAPGAAYIRADTGRVKPREQKIAERRADFAKWRNANIIMEDIRTLSRSSMTASIGIIYSMKVQLANGRIAQDSHIRERYDLRCMPNGKWLIERNSDFVPR
jgi:hypothetical protein